MKWCPPAEWLVAAVLCGAMACAGGTDKPKGFYGEVVAKKTAVDPQTGDPVVVLTVGFSRTPEVYEQDTRYYSYLSSESRFQVGDCVMVHPYGQEVRLTRCD